MDNPPGETVLAERRWLIGIGISLVFGVFGAVMALLSYAARDKSQEPRVAPTVTAAPTAAPAPRGHGKGHGRE